MGIFFRNDWRVVRDNGGYAVCRANEVNDREVVACCSNEKQARVKVTTLEHGAGLRQFDWDEWYND